MSDIEEYAVIRGGEGEDAGIRPMTCIGNCCEKADKNIWYTAEGPKFLTRGGAYELVNEYYNKIGVMIDYCPFCGGKLK